MTVKTHAITLVDVQGRIYGHKTGCRDLKRGRAANPMAEHMEFVGATKAETWYDFNSDFIAEGGPENAYDIEWAGCTKHIQDGDIDALLDALENEDEATEAEVVEFPAQEAEEAAAAADAEFQVEAKVGRKWTYLFVGGELIAELRNDQLAAIAKYAADHDRG